MGNSPSRIDEPSPEFLVQLQSLPDQQEERRRVGTSYGTSRVVAEAERIATEARVFKKAKQNKKAHDMYTQAIELDRFNHMYFYHRGETALNGEQFELAVWDSQCGLDLCQPLEEHKHDEVFGLLWCTITRSFLEMRQFREAKKYCEIGLSLVGECKETAFPLMALANYHSVIEEALAALPTDIAQVQMKRVQDKGDDLMFMYSTKTSSLESPPRNVAPLQPEILAVDLDMSMPIEEIFTYVLSQKLSVWSKEPEPGVSSFQVPGTKYWITAIPVSSKEHGRQLLSSLMCDCMKDSQIIVLKVEEAEEPSSFNTEAYIEVVVKNAPNCKNMYRKGEKLA